MPYINWESIKNAKILFIGGLGHGGTRAVMEYVKRCYDAFPGNVLNDTNDSMELVPLAYRIMEKASRGVGPTWNELADRFKEIMVAMLAKAEVDPTVTQCVFKLPEFLVGGFHLFSDLLPNAIFICVTRDAVPYSCGRRKEHESAMKHECSGQAIYPAIWAHTYGDKALSWDVPRHNKMALIWIFNQAWMNLVKTKLGDRLLMVKIEDMRDNLSDFAESMDCFTGWTNNGHQFSELCRARLKDGEDCDRHEKVEVTSLIGKALKSNAKPSNYYLTPYCLASVVG